MKDRVSHQLAGAVPCDLSTPINVNNRGAVDGPLEGLGAAPCGVHGFVLEQQHSVLACPCNDGAVDIALQLPSDVIGHKGATDV